jgi:hypothetical protein
MQPLVIIAHGAVIDADCDTRAMTPGMFRLPTQAADTVQATQLTPSLLPHLQCPQHTGRPQCLY